MSDMATERTDKKSEYSFKSIGEAVAGSLVKSSEELVAKAQDLLESTKALAADIDAQVAKQVKLIEDVDTRLRQFGETILEAHKKYLDKL